MLKYLSSSRSELMAVAILGILFVHSGIKIPNNLLNSFVQMGGAGVDLFFFLSGFGLYFSCTKDGKWWHFWLKRIKRIYPGLILCILISEFTTKGDFDWVLILKYISLLGYWIKALDWPYFTWFIPAILFLYLIFPFYFKIFRRYPLGATIHASLIGIFCAFIYSYHYLVIYHGGSNTFIHLFTRVPIFFIGTYMAYCFNQVKSGKMHISKTLTIILLTLPFFGYEILGIVHSVGLNYDQMRNSGSIFYPFILIIPGFALSVGYLIDKLPETIRRIMSVIGSSTLEIYLLIDCVYYYRDKFIDMTGDNISGCLLMMTVCTIFAIIVHYAIAYIMKVPKLIRK